MNRKFEKEINLGQIAEAAGTSISTVSRYFNGINIRANARKRIEKYLIDSGNGDLIREENRSKETSPAKLIGLLVPDMISYIFSDICMSVMNEAEKRGYKVITVVSQSDLEYERQALEHLNRLGVDALIYAPIAYMGYKELDLFRKNPLVIVNRRNIIPGKTHIYIDNIKAGYTAAKYMLGLNRTRIGVMLGSWHYQFSLDELCDMMDNGADLGGFVSVDRLVGYRKALEEEGVPFDRKLITMSTWSGSSAAKCAAQLISQSGGRIDGFIGSSDLLSLVTMQVLQKHGMSVPEDVSVIGWGDSVLAGLSSPALTSFSQSAEEMGVYAVDAISKQFEGIAAEDIAISSAMIPRDSTMIKRSGPPV